MDRQHTSSAAMDRSHGLDGLYGVGINGSGYLEDEPVDGVFSFENEEQKTAIMNHMNNLPQEPRKPGDAFMEPMTPYGSADPSAPAAAARTGPASGRAHLSSTPAWLAPEQSSPPGLTYSPSPQTPSALQGRQHANSRTQEQYPARQERHRHGSSRVSAQYLHQLPHQEAGQVDHHFNQLGDQISDLDLHDRFSHQQQPDQHASRRSRRRERGVRRSSNSVDEHFDDRARRPRRSNEKDPQHLRPEFPNGYEEPDFANPQQSDQLDERQNSLHPGYDGQRHVTEAPESRLEDAEIVDRFDEQAAPNEPTAADDPAVLEVPGYVVVISDEELVTLFNGDEESRVTLEKMKEQMKRVVQENGTVVWMASKGTYQWWFSPEMQKRRRAVGRSVANVTGQALSITGRAIMDNTPVGGICDKVSTSVTAFKSAPLTFMGLRRSNEPSSEPEPVIPDGDFDSDDCAADEDDVEEVVDEDVDDGLGFMGMGDLLYEE